MPTGFVTYYNNKKRYGFIDSPELNIEQIFFHRDNCVEPYSKVFVGDKIEFEFDPNNDLETGAKNITFIKNASEESLKTDFEKQSILRGFLKKIDGKYFVKDKNTYILIPITLEQQEINIEEVYEEKLNKLISYKITSFTSRKKLKAINIAREFPPLSNLIVLGHQTKANVVKQVKGGYQLKVYDSIYGFLPNSLVLKSKINISAGEIIDVTCIKVSENLSCVVFDLSVNFPKIKEKNLQRDQDFSKIKVGDSQIGCIHAKEGFGIFINIGEFDGLLHANEIIGETIDLTKIDKKKLYNALNNCFIIGQKLEIIIKAVTKNGITLTWDKSIGANRVIHEKIYSKYLELKYNY